MISTKKEQSATLAHDMAKAWLDDQPGTTAFAGAQQGGEHFLALVIKRTYEIKNGVCSLAAPDEQELLQEGERPYEGTEPPLTSPPVCVNDSMVLRSRTDVVIQALAYAYAPGTRTLTAKVRFGKHAREIVVFGERRGEFDRKGRPRFSEPEPIEVVPVRYDFAYGGVDEEALARLGDPLRKILQTIAPDADPRASTPYHYPRNPAGLGYLMEINKESFDGLLIPYLEYPFDPLSPARLAVGEPSRWLRAPLPAGWDWQSETWFPRLGYVGMAPDVDDRGAVPAEHQQGWAPRDILSIPPIMHYPKDPIRAEYWQAASPGMSVESLAPGQMFVLQNLHPNKPTYSFALPSEAPEVALELFAGELVRAAVHLDSIVVRPDPGELVMVWSARVVVAGPYTHDQVENMRREVRFVARKEA